MSTKPDAPFSPLNIAVLTVSDTRTLESDSSGQLLVDSLQAAGHTLADRQLYPPFSPRRHGVHRPRQHAGGRRSPAGQAGRRFW